MAIELGIEFARALSRLIAAATPPADPALRAMVAEVEELSRARALRVELADGMLFIDGEEVPFELDGIEALITALFAHQVRSLRCRQFISGRELLNVASLLASSSDDPQDGATIEDVFTERRIWNIEVIGEGRPDDAPATQLPAELAQPLLDDADVAVIESSIEKIVASVESAAGSGNAGDVAAALLALQDFAGRTQHEPLRERCEQELDKLVTPMAMKLTAQLLPKARVREPYHALLARAGAVGAEALFAHLVAAEDIRERRVFFHAIASMREAIPLLIESLQHEQWYVVRNAAELLGEMGVADAHMALARMLRSSDERMRIAASSALARIATPEAMNSLQSVVRDPSPRVRFFANTALLAKMQSASAKQLAEALDSEEHAELQLQIIAALGRLGTPDAVQKLIRALLPKPPGSRETQDNALFRCAAIEAVASARGPAALPVIRPLMQDRDPDVRRTARRVHVQLAR